MSDVKIYTKRGCPYCAAALELLDEKAVPYQNIEVGTDPVKRRKLAEETGRGTVPQVFINGTAVGGYAELSALDAEGELDELLAGASPPFFP